MRLVVGVLVCGLDAYRQVETLVGMVRLGAAAEIFLTELGAFMAALSVLRGLWGLWRRRFTGKA